MYLLKAGQMLVYMYAPPNKIYYLKLFCQHAFNSNQNLIHYTNKMWMLCHLR